MNNFNDAICKGDFRIQVKAENMLSYTIKMVSNTKYFPNWMRGSLVRIIVDHATDIFDNIVAANETRSTELRMEYQHKVIRGCAQLTGLVDLSERDGLIKMEKALKWAKLVKDVQNMTTAWLRNTSS